MDTVQISVEPVSQDGRRRRRRSRWELLEEQVKPTWRELPTLIRDSLKLVWASGRGTFLLTAILQIVSALAVGAQLFVTKAVLSAVLHAGSGGAFSGVLPELAALVALTVALDVARAVENEQSRVLSELVGRRAFERVIDVATRIDLLAFESPDFYDRLRRATMQGQFRALQTVQSLLGLVGAAVSSIGIVAALTTLQPLLLPLVAVGIIPLWIVTRLNTRDTYRFSFGMTPNDRQRNYLQYLLLSRDPAKEIRSFELAPFLRKRYDRLYDERIAEARALARRRTVRSLAGALASSAVTAGAVASLAYLYTSDRMSLATIRSGGVRPLPARWAVASPQLQRRLALRVDDLHPRLHVLPRARAASARGGRSRAGALRAADGGERHVHVSGRGPARAERRLTRDRRW